MWRAAAGAARGYCFSGPCHQGLGSHRKHLKWQWDDINSLSQSTHAHGNLGGRKELTEGFLSPATHGVTGQAPPLGDAATGPRSPAARCASCTRGGGQPARGQQTRAVRMHSVKKHKFCFLVWFSTRAAGCQVPRWLTCPHTTEAVRQHGSGGWHPV